MSNNKSSVYEAVKWAKEIMEKISENEEFSDLFYDASNHPQEVAELIKTWMIKSLYWGYARRIAFWTVIRIGGFSQGIRPFCMPSTRDAMDAYADTVKMFQRRKKFRIEITGDWQTKDGYFAVDPFTGDWEWS